MKKQSLYFIKIWQEGQLKMFKIQLNTKLGGEGRGDVSATRFSNQKKHLSATKN